LGQEAWGHVVAKLLRELPVSVPEELIERGKVLDGYYILPHYPNGFPEGAPFEHFGSLQAKETLKHARLIEEVRTQHDQLLKAYDETIEGWAMALSLKEDETAEHSQRVTRMTVRMAELYGLRGEELLFVRWGALLHDVGKIGIPDAILLKPGPLAPSEWEIMKKHPVYAFEMLSKIDYLRKAVDIPYCHHERFDGSGYPRGLRGKEIPLPARLFAVVDVWDALISDRPYRKAWSKKDALAYIRFQSGKHFDPQAVELFLRAIAEEEAQE